MKNSLIISFFIGFGKKINTAFHNSCLFRVLNGIYIFFSDSWFGSRIINAIKNIGKSREKARSFLYKTVHFPFWIMEKTAGKFGDKIDDAYKNSFILNSIFSFSDNAMALNTKFYGLLIISFAISRQIFAFSVSYKLLAAMVFGLIIALSDFNITDFFAESKLVKFVLSAIGFSDFSWKIYEEDNIKKTSALILGALVGILSGFLSLKSVIFAALPFVAIIGMALILKNPVIGILASAFLAPFIPTMLLAGLIIFTSFCFCFESLRKGDFKWKLDSVGVGLGLFLIFMFLSSVFSFSRTKSLMVWGLYLVFIGYYFIITNAVKTTKQLSYIVKVFVLAGLFVSIYGIMQYVFGWNTSNAWIDEEMFENATMRVYSTMENPNVLGEYLLFVIPLSAFLMLKSSFKSLEKWFWLGTLAASTLCMVLTQSRGCWIGLFVAIIIFVTFYNGKLWGLLPLVFLALPFIIPQTMIDRFLSVGNLEDSSTSYRVFIWLGTLLMLRDFWIGGIGMGEGAFRTVYPFYSYNSIIAPHSHNLYLQIITEGGISALIIFVSVLCIYLKKIAMIFSHRGKNDYVGVLALTFFCAVFGFLVQSMFDYTFYNYRMMSMFFIILGLSVSLENIGEENVC